MSGEPAHLNTEPEGAMPERGLENFAPEHHQHHYAYGMPYAQMQFSAPPYGMPPVMYPPHHMIAFPPHMLQLPSPPQQHVVPQSHGHTTQKRREDEVSSTRENEAVTTEGDKSWAQIARDPGHDKEDGPKAQQEQQQATSNQQRRDQSRNQYGNANANNMGQPWSAMVKFSVKLFQYAQDIYGFSAQSAAMGLAFDPFYNLALAYNVPRDIFDLAMNNQPLPPDYESYETALRHLRTISSAPNFLATVNNEELVQRKRQFFVLQCESEMDVFQFIKRSMWTVDTDESSNLLDTAIGQLVAIGQVIIIFAIPQLRKLVGCAEVVSQTYPVNPEDPEGERVVNLRWIFIRDIPIAFFRSFDCLSNPVLMKEKQAKMADVSNKEKDAPAADGNISDIGDKKNEDAAVTGEDEGIEEGGPGDVEANGREQGFRGNRMLQEGPKFYQIGDDEGESALRKMADLQLNGGILLDFGEYAAADEQKRTPDMSRLICGGPRRANMSGMQTNATSSRGGRGGAKGSMPRYGSGVRGPSSATVSNNRGRGGFSSSRGGGSSSFRSSQQEGGDRSNDQTANQRDVRRDDPQERRGTGRGARGGNSLGRGARGDDRKDRPAGSAQSTQDARDASGRGGRAGSRTAQQSRKLEGAEGATTLRSQYTFEIQTKKGKQPRRPGAEGVGQPASTAAANDSSVPSNE